MVRIGSYCSIAPNVEIITGGIHPINWVSLYSFRIQLNLSGAFKDGMPTTNGDVIIGNDVWICTGVTILSGVTIGDGAVLASKSLISRDVPPYSIVGGNPAKILRYRFDEITINNLLQIKWWNWPFEKILKEINTLSSDKIEEFTKKHQL
jgi:acetyltransferase-like isoleucine patch superfamily enzyme